MLVLGFRVRIRGWVGSGSIKRGKERLKNETCQVCRVSDGNVSGLR